MQWVDGIAVFSIFALFFLASWGIEFGLANAMLDEIPPHVVNNGVLVANAATYGLLGLYLLVGVLLLFWNERRREGVASRPIGQQRALPAADSPPTDPEGDRSQELESGGPDATHQATLPDGFSPSLGNRPVGLPCPVADDGSTMNQGDVENAT